jgi:hypothetical protein
MLELLLFLSAPVTDGELCFERLNQDHYECVNINYLDENGTPIIYEKDKEEKEE